MRRVWRNNGLSIVLALIFAALLVGQSLAGHAWHNEQQREHGDPEMSYWSYIQSSEFVEAVAENWESEFLQMACIVVLTTWLFQKGSAESNDPDAPQEGSRRRPDPGRPGAPGPVRRGGLALAIYQHSLLIAFVALFLLSIALHAFGGSRVHNEERVSHGATDTVSALQYIARARFWFESLQNWQSEFLAVFALVVLSIFLRQRGSSQSKAVDAPHEETGH